LSLIEVSAAGLPAAIVIRVVTIAATIALARRTGACRQAALGGSIVASAVTVTAAMRVIASGRPVDGVLVRHEASGIVLGYSVTPLSAWFLIPTWGCGGELTARTEYTATAFSKPR